MIGRLTALILVALAAGALAMALLWADRRPTPPAPPAVEDRSLVAAGIWLWGMPAEEPAASAPTAASQAAAPASTAARKPASHPDEWSVMDGRLVPTVLLRERFDRLRKERTPAADQKARAQVLREAQAAHGAALAQQIIERWDRYIEIEHHPWQTRLDLQDRSTWQAALDERQTLQAQRLGLTWAMALYGDDNRWLQDLLDMTPQGASAVLTAEPQAPPASDAERASAPLATTSLRQERIKTFGPEVTAALERSLAQRVRRELKLVAARNEWKRLKANPALDDARRETAMRSWIRSNFTTEESARALIAVGLP